MEEAMISSEGWKPEGTEGVCVSGKFRYPDAESAASALERVQERRRQLPPEDKPPERAFYLCPYCDGWHLTSRAQELTDPEPLRYDGETWQSYALRLERRVKEQRDLLERLNVLRADAGNRRERKRIELLTASLGRATLRIDALKASKIGLVEAIQSLKLLLIEAWEFPDRPVDGSRQELMVWGSKWADINLRVIQATTETRRGRRERVKKGAQP